MIYFDNAATSWPKPERMGWAMLHYLNEIGASPGRSGHRLALDAGRIILETRENLAILFNIDDPGQIVFTKNVTEAINTAIFGLLEEGDRVLTSAVEHNSVMRPLRWLESQKKITLELIPCNEQGLLDIDALIHALKKPTRLVALTHASNVTGVINPLSTICPLVKAAGAHLLLDVAQTAGAVPIDLAATPVDLLAFTGHKSLLGPTGTGGLVIGDDIDSLQPLILGGTGSESEFEFQPEFLPDRLESGTINSVGIAGLMASTQFLLETGIKQIQHHEQLLIDHMLAGLTSIDGVTVYGPRDTANRAGVVSFNIAHRSPSEVGLLLDEEFDIMCRVGLHCAPAAHRAIGTFPTGSVRFGLGYFNTLGEVTQAVSAIDQITAR